MNPNFNRLQEQLERPFAFKIFLFKKVPSAFFAGLRLEKFTAKEASISVGYKWFNKNPFNSTYFAVLAMAAEASTGILCMSAIYKRKPSVSILIVKIEGTFIKKATGKIVFSCADGMQIQQAAEDAIATGEGKSVICKSTGKNEAGETVAEFLCTWSFKSREVTYQEISE